MFFNLNLIAFHLKIKQLIRVNCTYTEPDIENVCLLPEASEWPSIAGTLGGALDRTLFIATFENIQKQKDCLPIYLICIGGQNEAAAFMKKKEVRGLVLPQSLTTLQVYAQIMSLFHRYNRIEDRLMQAMLISKDIVSVLNICSQFFKNPVLLLNEALRVIGLRTSYKHDPEESSWRETETTGYISEALLNSMDKAGLLPELEHSKQAILVDVPNYPKRLVANIFSNGHRTISLCVDECNAPLTMDYAGLIEYIAQLIGTYLLTNRSATGHQPLSFVDCISALIQGVHVDNAELRGLLRMHGWSPHDCYRIAILQPSPSDSLGGTTHFNLDSCLALLNDTLSVEINKNRVLLLHAKAEAADNLATYSDTKLHAMQDDNALESSINQSAPTLPEAFCKRVTTINAMCSVSMPFRDLHMLQDEYRLTLAALNLAQSQRVSTKKNDADHIIWYRDYLMKHVIELCKESFDLRCLCDSGIVALHQYDSQHDTELLTSLMVYLDCSSNLIRAAQKLCIHRNSLVYHLNRAQEIAGFDFERPGEVERILFSCEILQYLDSKNGL